jgi:hypothetical protein
LSSYLYDLDQPFPPSLAVRDTPAALEGRLKRHGAAVDALLEVGPKAVPLSASSEPRREPEGECLVAQPAVQHGFGPYPLDNDR